MGSNFPARVWTLAPCFGSSESQPLDYQGSPKLGTRCEGGEALRPQPACHVFTAFRNSHSCHLDTHRDINAPRPHCQRHNLIITAAQLYNCFPPLSLPILCIRRVIKCHHFIFIAICQGSQHPHPFNLSCMQPLAQYFKLILKINFFNWSAVDLPCCVNFCCTATWFSYTYLYVCIIFLTILFHYDLSQDIKYSSLGYTLGPCLLSIRRIKAYVCSLQPPTPSLPELPPPWQPPVCPWFWFCAQRFIHCYTVGP